MYKDQISPTVKSLDTFYSSSSSPKQEVQHFSPYGCPQLSAREKIIRENEIEILKEHQKKQKKNSIKAGTGLSETKTSEIANHPTNKSSPL